MLGRLICDPRPLRTENLAGAPGRYGFPPNHPEMHGFLGVPILIDAQAWGNLYFADKRTGAFDWADERLAVTLARRAAGIVYAARTAGSPATAGTWTTPHI